MVVFCDFCGGEYTTHGYYRAHLAYAKNMRCKLALDKREGRIMNVSDVLAKRKYNELTDFTLHDCVLGSKDPRLDDNLLGKMMGGKVATALDEEQISDDDDNNSAFGDDTENEGADTVDSSDADTDDEEETNEESDDEVRFSSSVKEMVMEDAAAQQPIANYQQEQDYEEEEHM